MKGNVVKDRGCWIRENRVGFGCFTVHDVSDGRTNTVALVMVALIGPA